MAQPEQPNVLIFHVDNLGYGELGCYGGGVLRGAETARIDGFAREGFKLLNYAPEAQCSPTRSALMTGRYSVRSGNTKATAPGIPGGLVAWERTMGALFSDAGYSTLCVGKWHIGEEDGRWPTDHGFDEWYGPPGSWDCALWSIDPWYDPERDVVSYMHESKRGEPAVEKEHIDYDFKVNVDRELNRRSIDFMQQSVAADKPFFVYHNHSLLHLPVVPREEYKGVSGHGDWADSLLELDGDFGQLLDVVEDLGVADNTIIIFVGDNGNEEVLEHRGTAGFWEGSYFTGMEGSLRTPCIVRWPTQIPSGVESNEIMHCCDWFTTLSAMVDLELPDDRVIDGVDQSPFLLGQQEESNREGFLYWNADDPYGVKWRNFKLVLKQQKYLSDPALDLPFPSIVNLDLDPKEREPFSRYLHTWVIDHAATMVREFAETVKEEELIAPGSPIDFVPSRAHGIVPEAESATVRPG